MDVLRPVAVKVVAKRPRVHATVVADVELAAGDQRGVLVRVRLVVIACALERHVGEAAEAEVPVRCDGLPLAAAVLALVDLFEAEIHVVLVRGVDREELVVPGLDARAVALGADPPPPLRAAAVGQLLALADPGPHPPPLPPARPHPTP